MSRMYIDVWSVTEMKTRLRAIGVEVPEGRHLGLVDRYIYQCFLKTIRDYKWISIFMYSMIALCVLVPILHSTPISIPFLLVLSVLITIEFSYSVSRFTDEVFLKAKISGDDRVNVPTTAIFLCMVTVAMLGILAFIPFMHMDLVRIVTNADAIRFALCVCLGTTVFVRFVLLRRLMHKFRYK